MRKLLFPICLTIIILGACGDPHEIAEEESIAALDEFFEEFDQGDLIIDSDNEEEVIEAVEQQLGEYFTGNFSRKVANDIRQSMKDDRDFANDPATITFFLTNSGDGFRFLKNEISGRGVWLTLDNEVVGTEIRVSMNPDNPEWPHTWSETATVTILEQDGEWNIDEVRYASGILEEDNSNGNDDSADVNLDEDFEPEEDQLLTLGETGTYASQYGSFELTAHDVRREEEVDGEEPDDDLFLVFDVTIENTSEESMDDTKTPIRTFNLAQNTDVSDFDQSELFDDNFSPGDTITGDLIFEAETSDTYTLLYGHSETNIINWEFDADDQSVN